MSEQELVSKAWKQYILNTLEEAEDKIEYLEEKVQKLISLMILTDAKVSDVEMNSVTARQWEEFIKHYPEHAR
jgi:hypothetical protein